MALTRGVSAGMLAALSGTFHPVVLVYVDWPASPVYYHTGVGTISFDGHDWLGVGTFGAISIPNEAMDLVPAEAILALAGRTQDLIAYMGVDLTSRRSRIYIGCVTEAGGNDLVDDPELFFNGYVDGRDFNYQRDDGLIVEAIALTIASGPSARSGAAITHTAADQESRYPGDTAGRHNIYATANRINPPKW